MVSGPRGNDRREQGSAQEKQEEKMALKRSIIQSPHVLFVYSEANIQYTQREPSGEFRVNGGGI